MKIAGQNFLITGANRGIGLAVAEMAAQEGAHLHLVLRRPEALLEQSLLKQGAKSIRFYYFDLGDRMQVESLANNVKSQRIDILFNNAGLLTGGLLEQQPLDEIYQMFQVNLVALVHLTRSLLPQMLDRRSGKIINNASVSAFMHFPCASTYSAAKAAVVAFTNSLNLELRGTGVSTLCLITPGIKTRMFDAIEGKYARHIKVPTHYLMADRYAQSLKAHILHDKKVFWPGGYTGLALGLARYVPSLFGWAVLQRFSRVSPPKVTDPTLRQN